MDFLPWSTFTRLVVRYDGDRRVRTLSCAEQFRAMAFAQPTYRESLRDIETCLSAQAAKLYHMGLRETVRRSTLADANETRAQGGLRSDRQRVAAIAAAFAETAYLDERPLKGFARATAVYEIVAPRNTS